MSAAAGGGAGPNPVDISYTPSPFSTKNKLLRVLWTIVWVLLVRPSPKPAVAWRRAILRAFGAKLGKGAKVAASTRVWAPWNLEMGDHSSMAHSVECYNQGFIKIGANTTISQYSHLCASTHDYTKPTLPLVLGRIEIGSGVWICSDAFVGPDVRIGDGVVVGARSSVFADLPEWTICVGNSAKPIKLRVVSEGD
ncbi:putative colanic acid biosynthesis acetyltransferase [Prosthecomicrobium hirschii]|uniref:putative colanic acid biosynthesis acetyltransferase n=1 Tax=Prosthecodimorpha hirschii TaxID=665126 RepID=UPI00221E931A|nr:putative colanic acid biosynthesis acetyltransferase [Prosthecomicrobium hirschii]MCW1843770.1 putative colanic acid biosynthesis acetyltransferase [Prosthecomicrobium hirschii]